MHRMREKPCYISVDVETSGPIPGEYSLLSIGACLVSDPSVGFEVLLVPISERSDAAAIAVCGMDLERLKIEGLPPADALALFRDWIDGVADGVGKPVFVGLNAPFDWSFVNYYFHRFAGSNPFGFAALDIKSLYMGCMGRDWFETSPMKMADALGVQGAYTHRALDDARLQAVIFGRLLRALREGVRSNPKACVS